MAVDVAHLCVPQNQALGVCRGFVSDIQVCGTHGREDLVKATITSKAQDLETTPLQPRDDTDRALRRCLNDTEKTQSALMKSCFLILSLTRTKTRLCRFEMLDLESKTFVGAICIVSVECGFGVYGCLALSVKPGMWVWGIWMSSFVS